MLHLQARNQLRTPGGSKSSKRGGTFFKLCAIVSKYVQHIFPVGAKTFLRGDSPPWLRACGLPNITKNKHFLAYFICFSIIRSCKPGCAPASPAAHLQCSTAFQLNCQPTLHFPPQHRSLTKSILTHEVFSTEIYALLFCAILRPLIFVCILYFLLAVITWK